MPHPILSGACALPLADETAFLDATAQADLVRRKEVTPTELVEAAIGRIERVNPQLNAVVTEMYDHGRQSAAGGIPQGPFAGVPFLMKDFLAEYAGFRFTEASAYLKDFVADTDTELVTRFKRAGLLTVGKTNAPEFAIGAITEPDLFGPTHNPWDLERTPGGSSGGAAAAVASGMVPMAHGNDAGGSIRIPAACCGVLGLKPTRGRVPLGPNYGEVLGGLVAEFALTRSVRDTAALLDAVAGPATGDPHQAPPPARPFVEEVGADTGQLKIALTTASPLATDVHPDCEAAARAAAALCEELGHTVVEDAPRFDAELLWRCFTTTIAVGVAWAIADWERRTGRPATEDSFGALIWSLRERGRRTSGPEYMLAQQDMQRAARDGAAFSDGYDAWLTPTLGRPPVLTGELKFDAGDPFENRRRQAEFTPFTPLSNATGQPALSVPLYWNDEGLPIGVHFVGRFGDEAGLIRLASQLEEARPWSGRRPPVAA